ncbi:uncharacterized protein [Lolium perenne]|uniref:uncharacterized protein n=1 Tax=Lolium perenne TaxID=4522 RepID=UPI0021F560BF|nr:uncharacterized protein LOC127310220 [Lolium perenne]
MDVGNHTETHHITAHGTTTLEVVYTNDEAIVERILAMYGKWLEKEKNRFVGLDHEYTPRSTCKRQEMAVVQIAMRQHVLVYHYSSSFKHCPALNNFFERKGITFTSVDTKNDKVMLALAKMHIPELYHVDIKHIFKSRVGMANLAEAIIDGSYKNRKTKFSSDKNDLWETKPLSRMHLEYAAKDGYVSYELYCRILALEL